MSFLTKAQTVAQKPWQSSTFSQKKVSRSSRGQRPLPRPLSLDIQIYVAPKVAC